MAKHRMISRKEANRLGLKFYFTGKACPFGHIAPRYVSCHRCTDCRLDTEKQLREQTAQRRSERPLSPRKTARAAGFSRYISLKPCARGHFTDRLVVNGSCLECVRLHRIARESENEAQRQKRKEYRKANAERYRSHTRNRRAAQKTTGAHTAEDIAAILDAQKNRCAYCRKRLGKHYHVDHIIPITKQGTNDRRNLQITCGPCNLRKHNKDPIVFAQSLGRLI